MLRLSFLALLIAAACGGKTSGPTGNGNPPASQPVTSVEVSPTQSDLDVGETVALTAVPRSADGTALDRTVTWESSDEAVATVDADGVVTGRGSGTAEIAATSEDVRGTAAVRVSVPVASVDVESPAQGLAVNSTVQLQATARAADGSALDRTISWTSSDQAVAKVDANGLVSGVGPGQVVITATAGGPSGDLVPATVSGTVHLVVTIDWTAYDGNWVGSWTNTTFGSTGAITATLTIDEASLQATLLLDVDGPVFGTQDPMPFTVVAPLGPTSIHVDYNAPQHGPIQFDLEPGDFHVVSVDVPAGGIDAWEYDGTDTETSHTATFTVHFTGGGSATGTVAVQKQ